jgi:hypothetical protein
MYNACVYTGSHSNLQYWNYVLGNMNMIVNSWYNNLSDKQTNMNKSTLNNSFPIFQYYEQVVRQRMSCAKPRTYLIKTVWWGNIVYQRGYFFEFHRKTYILLDKITLIVSYLSSSSTLSNWSLWANIMEKFWFWFVPLYQSTSILKALYLTAEKKLCPWSEINLSKAQNW